jgi:hypothetical protein
LAWGRRNLDHSWEPAAHILRLSNHKAARRNRVAIGRPIDLNRLKSLTPGPSNTRSHHISAPPRRKSSRVHAVELAGYRSSEYLRVDRECRRRFGRSASC